MRLAIFGASGFIGSSLCHAAARAGWDVLPLGRSVSQGSAAAWDIAGGAVPDLPGNIDAAFYLAQSRHYRNFPAQAADLFSVNGLGPGLAARAALAAGCRFFCHASSGNVYLPSFLPLRENSPTGPRSPYAASKLMGEMAAAGFDGLMKTMSVRVFGAYGPGQTAMLPWLVLQRIASGETIFLQPFPYGQGHDDGGLRISFIYIDDLCQRLLDFAALALGGKNTPAIVNLAGQEPVSLRQYALTAARILDTTPCFKEDTNFRPGDLAADISLLNSFCPRPFTPLKQGLQETVTWAKKADFLTA